MIPRVIMASKRLDVASRLVEPHRNKRHNLLVAIPLPIQGILRLERSLALTQIH
jgi:hypothetical protein